MRPIRGVVQHYDWGDTTFIPRLLGVEPDGRPWAELWFGTHPNGPATFLDGRPLREVTGDLPYLLKVIAAARPLSLQTHPDREQAIAGHAAGRYTDPAPKPELLYALTPFEALCGFRPIEPTLALLDEVGADALGEAVRRGGLGHALEALYRNGLDASSVVAACRSSQRAEARWVVRLDEMYPGDPSVAATLLLNLVRLQPGQVIRLTAGTLHAYLDGSGIELMAPSDNVVRGGLTTKPVDVETLLDTVVTSPLDRPVLPPADAYPLVDTDVELRTLPPGVTHRATQHELALTAAGDCWHLAPGDELAVTATTHVVTSA